MKWPNNKRLKVKHLLLKIYIIQRSLSHSLSNIHTFIIINTVYNVYNIYSLADVGGNNYNHIVTVQQTFWKTVNICTSKKLPANFTIYKKNIMTGSEKAFNQL